MRRMQALLVIVALLATPLALLARATAAGSMDCGGMCCLPHAGHHHLSQPSPHNATTCKHGSLGHAFECTMHSGRSGHQGADYGLLSPIAPTKPSALASIAALGAPRIAALLFTIENLSAGFDLNPFQPPRS